MRITNRLKEIIFVRALFGNQKYVLLSNCIVYSNIGASKSLKKITSLIPGRYL